MLASIAAVLVLFIYPVGACLVAFAARPLASRIDGWLSRRVAWFASHNTEAAIVWLVGTLALVALLPWLAALGRPQTNFASNLLRQSSIILGSFFAIVGTVLVARRLSAGYAILTATATLILTMWLGVYMVYLMHQVGWQGLELDDLGSDDMGPGLIFLGPVFMTPLAILPGALIGFLTHPAKRQAAA